MTTRGISEDIIKAIDALYSDYSKDLISSGNPVSQLITPEWHHSDSIEILGNIQISWDNLGKVDLIRTMADTLEQETTRDSIAGVEFERSFCSWYQPYHYLPRQRWGVHLRYDSWIKVASLFYLRSPSALRKKLDSIKSAFLYLYTHELFHNAIENAASVMEILLGKTEIYTKYYSEVYSNVFNSSDCIEEALSNGYLFLWAEECHIDRDFLRDELLKQGPGYSNFIQYEGPNFYKGNRILLSQIKNGNLNPTTYDPLDLLLDTPGPVRHSYIYNTPIWLHRKAKTVH